MTHVDLIEKLLQFNVNERTPANQAPGGQ
jgi:hypothetical protein